MIDAENDPGAVSNYFTAAGVVNQGYGNGISFVNFILGPYYRYTLEAACGIRAQAGRPRFIYVWTVNAHDELREYIRIGVDGAITDSPDDLRTIVAEGEFAPLIRLASRADNPFRPANFGYGLHVRTADKWMAGTDANVTFTITGAAGSVSKTVNTELIKRMESDSWNWVTVPSDDLGPLISLTVQRDDEGNGPDWYLDHIDVRSARFGTSGQAVFDRWIDDTTPFTESLVTGWVTPAGRSQAEVLNDPVRVDSRNHGLMSPTPRMIAMKIRLVVPTCSCQSRWSSWSRCQVLDSVREWAGVGSRSRVDDDR